MACRQFERRRDLALLRAMAHERSIAARTEGKPKSVEQNGLSRSGLPREDGEPRRKLDIEMLNENNVANGEPNQH